MTHLFAVVHCRKGLLTTGLFLAVLFQLALSQHAYAEQDMTTSNGLETQPVDYASITHFGGPTSVSAQVKSDAESKHTPFRFEGLSRSLQPYYDFKNRVNEQYGLSFGGDYNLLYQGASESPGEDNAAGGVLRIYGTWTLFGRGTQDTGSLVFKVENRHRLGTEIAPQQLGSEIGYAGLTAIPFSDAGTLLTNLFWSQSFNNNRLAFVAGVVDTTDYVSVYGLVSPWTDFSNLVFSTDPTIPAPNQGLGAATSVRITDNYYALAGFADANGDPANPADNFDTFFEEREYFKHLEFGWISSFKNRYKDNIHLTAWQIDERTIAGVDDGWGMALSFNKFLNESWLPFVRIGYSDGGGALLQRSVSTGVGYFRNTFNDVFGVGLNWGQPSKRTFGTGLDDQYTTEVYYRMQLFQHMTLTPNVQLLINPALNPDEDSIWVLGLRARLAF